MFSILKLNIVCPRLFKALNLAKYPLFLIYVGALLYIVFFARRRIGLIWSIDLINIIPFKHTFRYLYALRYHNNFKWFLLSNILGNILLFVPLPFFLNVIFKVKKTSSLLAIGGAISLSIEFLQFFFEAGVPDIDDIILNIAGLVFGLYFLRIFESVFKYHVSYISNENRSFQV